MAVTTTKDILIRAAQGKGVIMPYAALTSTNGTGAATASGVFSVVLNANVIGTTYPGTLQGFPAPTATNSLMTGHVGSQSSARNSWLGYFYRFGTVDLTATGDRFTHDSTFTELRRTVFGVANTAINLIPLFYVTTATSVTAPVVILKTAAGGNGYVDQDGNGTVGTISFTFPAAATLTQSCYIPMIEATDAGVQDILAVQVTTASTTGVISVFGFEPICPVTSVHQGLGHQFDPMFSAVKMNQMEPATPNSGAVTSFLGTLGIVGGFSNHGLYTAVTN